MVVTSLFSVHSLNCGLSRVSIMYVFKSTTVCCEAGVEDVAMTTVTNDLQVTTA